nr:MAG TPA: hypothetical protein [Bacteriophage sp.]
MSMLLRVACNPLLTSSCTLHRRKFLTNESVHICDNLIVLYYRLF